MKHTNSKRGSDGQFSRAEGPKAKRIEVWLQPDTVTLLDTLTKQWRVGRGKVIDQLLTRGPVPPAAWLELEQPAVAPPTTGGQSDAGPDFLGLWGTYPADAQRRKWLAVIVGTKADLSKVNHGGVLNSVTNIQASGSDKPQTIYALRNENVQIGRVGVINFEDPDSVCVIDEPQFHFLINRETLEPFTGGYPIPDVAIKAAQKALKPPTTSAPPEPTTGSIFNDPELVAMQERLAAQWEIAKADAKLIPCKPERVQSFKAHHKLPADRPLGVDAQQQLRDEIEADQRTTKGESIALEQRLVRLQERATPERLAQLADSVAALPSIALTLPVAREFLLAGLDAVGIKQRSKLVAGVWADLKALVPGATAAEETLLSQEFLLPEHEPTTRCMFWGTVIRLASAEGEAPEGTAEFLEWCGYSAHQGHAERRTNRVWDNFARTMRGKPSSDSDRAALGLPADAVLTRKGINDAYKQLAREHHPDAGGEAERFQRITEARDRLLLEVG